MDRLFGGVGFDAAGVGAGVGRHEPLVAPVLVPRVAPTGSPGESLERVVVRSFNDAPASSSLSPDMLRLTPPRT